MAELKEGVKASAFALFGLDEKKVSLKDFLGQKVILYFYPKDMTSGCTQEACDFRDSFPKFEKINAVVLGISKDALKLHKKFQEKYNLPFNLLSDESGEVCEKYDVWKEKSMYGKKYMGIERTTFLIDESGKIIKIFRKVKVKGHINEILEFLGK
ncbi:MAG: thioredoxin-dependent thiol peroxidase [Ignavibacteriales bacterium CG_4_9_14_3_um_filter_34_10]|nr:MAG: thioredoxin-dependent thiol peroxidase [Ignavibacteriales bacterium CG_4_9_14_3_um_filter_34_10]